MSRTRSGGSGGFIVFLLVCALLYAVQTNATVRAKVGELVAWGWNGGPAPTVTVTTPTALPSLPPLPGSLPSNTAPVLSVDPVRLDQALATLNALPVRERVKDQAYDRSCSPGHACSFGPAWSDDQSAPDGHNGCGTRDDVLKEQLVSPALKDGSRCVVVAGALTDPYTGATVQFAKAQADAVQIDHVYPLSLAFDQGANTWGLDKRMAFANDTALNLLVTAGPVNNFKSDMTAAQWLTAKQPANKTTQVIMTDPGRKCFYGTKYVAVAAAYGLPITPADKTALTAAFAACR